MTTGWLTLETKPNKMYSIPTNFDQAPREVFSVLVIHTDIMFVNKTAFLITCTQLGLIMVNDLGTTQWVRIVSSIRKKFLFYRLHVSQYKAHRFESVGVKAHGERSIHLLQDQLAYQGSNIVLSAQDLKLKLSKERFRR